jgi:hypothetical protein
VAKYNPNGDLVWQFIGCVVMHGAYPYLTSMAVLAKSAEQRSLAMGTTGWIMMTRAVPTVRAWLLPLVSE